MLLYVNACVRPMSRTDALARFLLSRFPAEEIAEVNLQKEGILPLDWETIRYRDSCIAEKRFDDPVFSYARQFAQADEIVISAPYWDLLFPASLRAYLERVCVVGVTFAYSPQGAPVSLCRAKKLTYVSTAGGFTGGTHLGFSYVKALASQFFGIGDLSLLQAEGLDIDGADVEAILDRARASVSLK